MCSMFYLQFSGNREDGERAASDTAPREEDMEDISETENISEVGTPVSSAPTPPSGAPSPYSSGPSGVSYASENKTQNLSHTLAEVAKTEDLEEVSDGEDSKGENVSMEEISDNEEVIDQGTAVVGAEKVSDAEDEKDQINSISPVSLESSSPNEVQDEQIKDKTQEDYELEEGEILSDDE